jgi:hypothetical protein
MQPTHALCLQCDRCELWPKPPILGTTHRNRKPENDVRPDRLRLGMDLTTEKQCGRPSMPTLSHHGPLSPFLLDTGGRPDNI